MSKIVFILLLLVVTRTVKAQTNLDSLHAVWQDETRPDSSRALAYKDYIWNGFVFSYPDSAFMMADELIAIGKKMNSPYWQANGLNIKGASSYIKGDYPKALDYYTQRLNISEQSGDQNGVSAALNNIGLIYYDQGYYPKAMDYYVQSLKIDQQMGFQHGIGNTLMNIGNIFELKSDYSKALDYYNQGLQMHKQVSDQHGIANTLNNIGNIYNEQGDYPKALNYYLESLEIKEQIGDQLRIATSLIGIGSIYQKQGDYSKAQDKYVQSLTIHERLGDKQGIARSLMNIGNVYNIQSDYPKALNYCQKSYKLALSIGLLEEQKSACLCLYNSYKAMGKSNEALVYMEKMRVVEDSINLEETAKTLLQMEFAKQVLADSIATVEKERLVEVAHQEEVRQKNKTRNILFSVSGLVIILAGGIYSRLRYIRKSKAILQVEKDRSENLLLNILPADIAAELKVKGKVDARDFDMVSILFTDFKEFTVTSAKLSAQDLVMEINTCFEAFDGIIGKYNIEKIKTIGDSYMAAGGLPVPSNDSVKNTIMAALEMQKFISNRKEEFDSLGKPAFEMRVGVHTGPVVAGIVGVKKFQYDIWGDTVNTSSRMESNGEVGKVNISQSTYELLKDDPQFSFESRGKIEAKGKGEIEMYFVSWSFKILATRC